jgi:carboxypeptidase Q
MRLPFIAGAMLATVWLQPLAAQSNVTADLAKIRAEGTERSQVMEIASWLTDVHGPRLTNSPYMHRAAEYAKSTMEKWGLSNVHYHYFPFGRGWANERAVAQVIEPVPHPLLIVPGAWTVGTNGPVTTEVVAVDLPDNATDADYARWSGKLRGKVVLAGPPPEVSALWNAPGTRLTEENLDRLAAATIVPAAPVAGGGQPQANEARMAAMRARFEAQARRAAFWVNEGVAAILVPGASRGNSGSVSNAPTGNRQPDAEASVPQIAVATEHYGRIWRTVEKGVPVRMELDIRNRFFDSDLNSYNIIAEIPGSDPALRDEVVMVGAHFDSWHGATGATDNGGSSAIMMEVMRILKETGVPLRRTVRIGLWTGEEQGLIGSRMYTRDMFWDTTTNSPKPAHDKFSVYFNLDNGAGAIRGIYAQGNEKVVPIFQDWMKHVDSDSISVRHVTLNSTGSTDHVAFDAVGLPGFQFIQDPIEYFTRTHHSSQDLYERLQPVDMRHNAVVIATFAYLAANADEKLPRKE